MCNLYAARHGRKKNLPAPEPPLQGKWKGFPRLSTASDGSRHPAPGTHCMLRCLALSAGEKQQQLPLRHLERWLHANEAPEPRRPVPPAPSWLDGLLTPPW